MYTCKGCGGYLKFDIESQELKCESCASTYPVPDEANQNMEAEYEAKIYSCPQCGGELIGDDNEAVVFCSFCGASNVLKERYEREKRPAKIIPFKVTKEQCKKIYMDRVKSSIFAPRAMKDPKFIESFRGIYMPFYLYNARIGCNVAIPAETVAHGITKDTITEYMFRGQLKGTYQDIPHDASSSFADDISESIAPYNNMEARPFATGYMSGFYADTADVSQDIYKPDVKKIAQESAARIVDSDAELRTVNAKSSAKPQINPNVDDVSVGLYPVWFMSYKNKDRIAYAAINGQNGRIALDVPVDIKKYFLITLLFAIPIFAALNFLITLTPKAILYGAMLFIVISAVVAIITQKNLSAVLSGAKDKGLGKVVQKKKTVKPFIIILIVAFVIDLGIAMIGPVKDIPYYAGIIIAILAVATTMVSLVSVFNTISTRPLPQFKRRGGDDNA